MVFQSWLLTALAYLTLLLVAYLHQSNSIQDTYLPSLRTSLHDKTLCTFPPSQSSYHGYYLINAGCDLHSDFARLMHYLPNHSNSSHYLDASSLPMEVEDAVILSHLVNNIQLRSASSLKLAANVIHKTIGTIGGITSTIARTVGGLCNLISDLVHELALYLGSPRSPYDPMPHSFDYLVRNLAKPVQFMSDAVGGVGEALIISGETIEMITGGLVEAVDDSFNSLSYGTSLLRNGLLFTLRKDLVGITIKQGHRKEEERSKVMTSTMLSDKADWRMLRYEELFRQVGVGPARDDSSDNMEAAEPTERSTLSYDIYRSQAIYIDDHLIGAGGYVIEDADRAADTLADPPQTGEGDDHDAVAQNTSSSSHGSGGGLHDPLLRSNQYSLYLSYCFKVILVAASGLGSLFMTVVAPVVHAMYQGHHTAVLTVEAMVKQLQHHGLGMEFISALAIAAEPDNPEIAIAVPSLVPHIVGTLVVIFMVVVALTNTKYTQQDQRTGEHIKTSSYIRHSVLGLLIISMGLYLCHMDIALRSKLVTQTRVRTMYHYAYKHHRMGSKGTDTLLLDQQYSNHSLPQLESSEWLNTLVASIWIVDGQGGVGPYTSELFEETINAELATVPQGIANIQFRRFSLGTKPPVIVGARVMSTKALICLANSVDEKADRRTAKPWHRNTRALIRSYVDYIRNIIATDDIPNSSSDSGADTMLGSLEEANGQLLRSPKTFQQTPVPSTGCQRLVLDVDFAYVSENMDIELSLRASDIKSVLPEALITLAALSIHGQMRLDIELTPAYPFVGNATVRKTNNMLLTSSVFFSFDHIILCVIFVI